jgi:TetR/AcrR family acrAB operon transcriptional repressor
MVRKTREEALATREQLLDAAEHVFQKRGVGHTTLAEVADAAGLTRGAIYWHFKSKAELFEAMVARAELPIDSAMEQMDSDSLQDPLGAVRAMAIHALTHLAESPRTQAVFDVVFLRCEYTDDLKIVEQRHLADRDRCISRVQQGLEQAVRKGQLPAQLDARLAAQGMYAFVGGLMRDWVQDREAYDLEAVAPQLIDVYLGGLGRSPLRAEDSSSRAAQVA